MITRILHIASWVTFKLTMVFFLCLGYSQVYAYDFSAISPLGQVLYYQVLSGQTAQVVCPNADNDTDAYHGFSRPIGSLEIPEVVEYLGQQYQVVSIGCRAFQNADSLELLHLPNSITNIGVAAFQGCHRLETIHFGTSLQIIDSLAFQGCSMLHNLDLPSSLSQLGNESFANCTTIRSMVLHCVVPPIISSNTFFLVPDTIQLFVPCGASADYLLSDIWSGFTDYRDSLFFHCTFRSADFLQGTVVTLQYPNCMNSQVQLYADALDGYHFLHWSDGSIQNPYSVGVIRDTSLIAYFAEDTLSVILQLNNSNMGEVHGGGEYQYQDMASLQAIPYKGYHFVGWNDGDTTNPRILIVTHDTTLTANFAVDYFGIAAVSSDTAKGNVMGEGHYPYLDTISLTAVANIGYRFVAWNDGDTANPRTLVVAQDSALVAEFAANDYEIVSISADTAQGEVVGGGQYVYLDTAILLAVPHRGYHFVSWSDSVLENPRLLIVTHDTTLIANFAVDYFDIAAVSSDTSKGSVVGSGHYPYLDTILLSVISNTGYHFESWNDGDTANPRTLVIEQDSALVASFTENIYDVVAISADTTQGEVVGGGQYAYRDTVTLQAMSRVGYHFVSWNDCVEENPRTVIVTHDTTMTANFAVDYFDVAAVSSDTSKGRVIGSGHYPYIDTILLSAIANTGYHFESWNDGDTANPRTLVVEQDSALVASFAENTYDVVAISADTTQGEVVGSGQYAYRDTVTLLAVPHRGYHFILWNDGVVDNPRAIEVLKDTSFRATFLADSALVSALCSDSLRGIVIGGGKYLLQDVAVLTAVPVYGYHFSSWSDGDMSNPRYLAVTKDTVVTASFDLDTFRVHAVSCDTLMGTVSGNGQFAYRTVTSISATPNPGYHFVSWSDGVVSNPRVLNVVGDTTVLALFAANNYTLSVATTDTTKGQVYGSGFFPYQSAITISAIPFAGYHFVSWNDGDSTNPRLITVQGDAYYSAYFVNNQYDVVAASSSTESGSVLGSGNYDYGTTVVLVAVAASGYHFTQWSDGSVSNPRTVVVGNNINLTAYFAMNNYHVSASSNNDSAGFVIGGGSATYNAQKILTAVPNYGYHFTQWSDGSVDNPRTIIVTSDIMLEAQFVMSSYNVMTSVNDQMGGFVQGGGLYNYRSSAIITATPYSHYHFVQWSDSVTVNPRTILVSGDTLLSAQFVIDSHTLVLYSADEVKGYVNGPFFGVHGSVNHLVASPNYGYRFARWSDGSTQNPRRYVLENDDTLTAYFELDDFEVSVIINSDTLGVVAGAGYYPYLSEVSLTAVPVGDSRFVKWSDGVVDNPRWVQLISDTTFYAEFVSTICYVSAFANDTALGTIIGVGEYHYQTNAQLEAVPSAHCHFVSWSDGITTNPRLFFIESDTLLVAQFVKNDSVFFAISSNDSLLGRVGGSGYYYYGDSVTILAVPVDGAFFSHWEDGSTDNPRILVAISDLEMVAYFEYSMYHLSLSASDNSLGVVYGEGDYLPGTNVAITAVPFPGVEFVSWSDGITENPRVIAIMSDTTLVAQMVGQVGIGDISYDDYTFSVRDRIISINVRNPECVTLFDINGRILASFYEGAGTIDIPVSSRGVYLLKVGNCVSKVVVL